MMLRRRLNSGLGLWLVAAALLGLVGSLVAAKLPGENAAKPEIDRDVAVNSARALSQAFRNAASDVLPSVVAIRTVPQVAERPRPGRDGKTEEDSELPFREFRGTPSGDLFRDHPELRRFFEQRPSVPRFGVPGPRAGGLGSGVVIDRDGIILTNNHVVAGAAKVSVQLQDGREFEAVEILRDPRTDLAVLRIDGASNLTPAKLGDSDAAEVGDWVLALGEPFGLEGTVTAGIISAKGRGLGIAEREDFIQTDAAINPGNSGGPLVNLDGEVVGINTAISSRTGGNQGVGFAVPINLAKWVAEQLIETGAVRRAYLGVVIQPVTHELSQHLGVKARQGVLVTEVMPDTPGERAGLEAGDVVVEFAGRKMTKPIELQGAVERKETGSEHPIVVLRDGERRQLKVTVGEQPVDFGRTLPRGVDPEADAKPERSQFEALGLQVENLTDEVAEHLGLQGHEGVLITEVQRGSPAAGAGLTAGVLITHVDRQPVADVNAFSEAVEAASSEKGVLLRVRDRRGARFIVIKPQD